MSAVQPFQLEPERVVNTEEGSQDNIIAVGEEEQEEEQERIGNTDWCGCGNCLPMLTERESVCCQELHFISAAVQGKVARVAI